MPELNEFNAIDINYELARVSSSTSNKVTLFIFAASGMFLSIMYVFVIFFYRKHKSLK